MATSNIAPDGLYKNGIHRDRFIPTIEMVKKHCQVLNVDAGVDYRLRVLKQAQLFKSPLTQDNQNWMAQRFSALTNTQHHSSEPIIINQASLNKEWCNFWQNSRHRQCR